MVEETTDQLHARISRQMISFEQLRTEYSRLFNVLKQVKEGTLNVCQIELGNDSWKINQLPAFESSLDANGEVPPIIQNRIDPERNQ